MALPTIASTARAGGGLIRNIMSPITGEISRGVGALTNPLATVGAAPAAGMAVGALGTMFAGDPGGGGGGGRSGGGGSGGGFQPSFTGGAGSPGGGMSGAIFDLLDVQLKVIVDHIKSIPKMEEYLEDIRDLLESAEDRDKRKERDRKRASARGAFGTGDEDFKALEAAREAARAAKAGGGGAGGGGGGPGTMQGDENPGGIGGSLWGIGKGIQAIGKGIAKVGKGIGKAVFAILSGIARGVMAFANPAVLAGAAVIAASLPIIALGIAGVMEIFNRLDTDFEPVRRFLEALQPLFDAFGDILEQVIVALGKAVSIVLTPLIDKIDLIQPLIQILSDTFVKLVETIVSIVPPLERVLTSLFENVTEIVTVLSNTILGVIDGINRFADTMRGIANDVIEGVVGGIERLAAVDGMALLKTAGGIAAIAGSLALLGGGSVLGAVGEGVGNFIRYFTGADDPLEKLKKFGEIGPQIEQAGKAIFGIGTGLKMLDEADLSDLGNTFGPFVDKVKGPMQELSAVTISPAQAQAFAAMQESQLQASERTAASQNMGSLVGAIQQNINNTVAESQVVLSTPSPATGPGRPNNSAVERKGAGTQAH